MDEEQRAEFVEIRERELKMMEKKLTEKQHELDAHVSANEKMQVGNFIYCHHVQPSKPPLCKFPHARISHYS